ncbi:MAG: DNA-binding response regulator, partial [Dehalococcoidaceae bacterium]|nr:DNA-binding response regulator [Dehalococcoidaceae bacterium]
KENINQIKSTLENDYSNVTVLHDLEKFDLSTNADTVDLIIVEDRYILQLEKFKNFFINYDIPVLLIVESIKLIKHSGNGLIADIISMPINLEELLYRVRKLTNSEKKPIDNKNKIAVGDLIIDLEKYTVSVERKIIDLTFKEFELLTYLANNIDTPFTRDSLLDKVWGYDYIGGYRTVDVHIRRIRSKIERNFQYIQTVRNIGYRFIDPKENN